MKKKKKISDCRLQTKSMGKDYKGNCAWSICSLQWSVSFNEILTWNCFCIIHPSDEQKVIRSSETLPPEQLLAPFPSPPPSISSPSMLFCMVTFAFKKIEREEGERTLSWTLSWRSIPTNYFWECWSMKKTLTIWNSLGNHSSAFLFMCMRSNNCIFFCSFDTALINLSTRESTFDRWKICTKVYLAIYSNNPRLHSKLNW